MKYKVKYYPNGRIFIVEDYPGIDIDVGKQKPEREESINLTKEQAKEIKAERTPNKIKKKLRQVLKSNSKRK